MSARTRRAKQLATLAAALEVRHMRDYEHHFVVVAIDPASGIEE